MFKDRRDAAERLATKLSHLKGKRSVVLGIPRGGVVTAFYVARSLQAELSLVVTRKLGYPSNPEAAFGALAEDGTTYLSPYARKMLNSDEISDVVAMEQKEIVRRINVLRKGKPLPDLHKRNVIIVDDGIATGATVFATILMSKKLGAGRVVVAAPVCGRETRQELEALADEVIILQTPSPYHAVSQVYDNFEAVSDEEAIGLLERWETDYRYVPSA